MSSQRQRSVPTGLIQQTIEEAPEMQSGYRLRNPSYKLSLKENTDNNMETKEALKEIIQDCDNEVEAVLDEEQEVAAGTSTEMPCTPQVNRLTRPTSPLLRMEEWQGKNHSHKLDSVFDSINKLYNVYHNVAQRIQPLEVAVFDQKDGILPQVRSLADYAKDADSRVDNLIKENASLREEIDVVKGVLHKQSKQIAALQGKQAHQTARSMAENITVGGIVGDSKEANNSDARMLVLAFLEEELEIEVDPTEVFVTHWMGQYVKDRHRSVIMKVTPHLKTKILDNTYKLAKKKNSLNKPFSVNVQLPEMLAEQKREIRQIIKTKREEEKSLDDSQKSKILVKNNKVYINGQLQRKLLKPPTVDQLFDISQEEKEKMDKIKLKFTQPKPAKSNEFMGAACIVESMNEVHLAYRKLFLKFPGADHIIAAFSCEGKQGYQDDSEFSAGFRVLNVINDTRFSNLAVFIIRDYGGEHLGPTRFTIIKELAEEAIQLIF